MEPNILIIVSIQFDKAMNELMLFQRNVNKNKKIGKKKSSPSQDSLTVAPLSRQNK